MLNISTLLTTEGTYPYNTGGVSTWCHKLITNLPQVDYQLMSIIDNPFTNSKYKFPNNIKDFISIPLWGTEEPSEHLDWLPFAKIFTKKLKTSRKVIKQEFLPTFSNIIDEILSIEKKPKAFGENLLKMYEYFNKYDYLKTLKSVHIYEFYKKKVGEKLNKHTSFIKECGIPTIFELNQSLGWVYRFLNITNTDVPKTDITHASAAGFCGIPNVISKLMYNTPFILTEHGVYMREQYLSANKNKSVFLKYFFTSLTESIVRLCYHYSDIICPVCSYNSRWEKMFGVNDSKIQVIYNGVDPKVFEHDENYYDKNKIIAVSRIDPLKDIENFIYAAKKVNDVMPQITFSIFGSVSDENYYKKCVELRDVLGLKHVLTFEGHVNTAKMAYHSGDIVVLSSISEGFPYTVVEAMMCGKAVVATDVGGVGEALDDCGILVSPRNSRELAQACIELMNNKDKRMYLGFKARERAVNNFTIQEFTNQYLKVYSDVSGGHTDGRIE